MPPRKPAAKKPKAAVPVEVHKHTDKRPNIPTRETAAFADDAPQSFVANRDRSLDPQLVWKGKDEQDAKPFEVPAVAIHVQEKIHPQAVIEDVRSWARAGKPVYDLFADFNGLPDFAQKLEFYQHEQHWTNRLILGDSLLVMASLAEKERLRGRVQCIYFDPPYGIRFGSNWQVSTRKRDVKDAKAEDLTRQPEQIKAFRDTWELGIHSYLTYLRDRLVVARYLPTILENLRKAGVKGTVKSQRIAFTRLDPFPGGHIQAEGETDAGLGVRVSVGPEFGTVGDAWIKAAAIEAVKGSRCDLLLVCAFAFEGSVHEQTAELTKEIKFGKLSIVPVRMNPDLAMGDELLKKTGAGNLFTVFGEPDVKIAAKDGKTIVTIRGVDVFDPGTGEVRTGGTDDIACWFIDTDYDGQSFFVRHAYFLGADEPYEKLKKSLRAEIDEGEWSKLYSATSQPFDPPKSGRIAVKVINHFGDEVLKVYPVKA